ncbi:right-handed parallel beta-helix repeat-containing protein [Chitinophaga japonensis]|nr:right-handed parallel beta-helix repeat-containing protein [Chitinophaga japonensis]
MIGNRKLLRLLLIGLAAWSLPALAATPAAYYVDAIAGSDACTGRSPQQAWRSLEKVNRHVFQPGDTLFFRAGRIYEGQLKPQGSGSREQAIVMDRYGAGYKPRIQGNGVMPAALHLYNVAHWQVRNLDISNYGPERSPRRAGVLVQLQDFGTAASIVLQFLDVHDVNGSLVKKEGGGAGIIVQNGGRRQPSRFDGLLIADCTIRRCERNGILVNGYWSRTEWHPNLHVVIRNNLLEGVPGDGIVPTGCDGALVEHNVMRDCPRLLPDGEAAAGIWPWSCDNTLVQYNEVSDHKAPWDGQGFDSDWNCNNTVIQYNYSHDNEGGFLLVCNDGSAKPPHNAGNRNTIVRYNVSINDGLRTSGRHAGFAPIFHIAGPVLNTRIYNNLIILPPRSPQMDSTLVEMGDWHGYADSTFFGSNIFCTKAVADYRFAGSRRNYFRGNVYTGRHLDKPADKGPADIAWLAAFLAYRLL